MEMGMGMGMVLVLVLVMVSIDLRGVHYCEGHQMDGAERVQEHLLISKWLIGKWQPCSTRRRNARHDAGPSFSFQQPFKGHNFM